MPFGERLRELRKEAGLSQRDLAERVEIDFTYLSKIENARVEPPSETVIRKIGYELSEVLKVDMTELTDQLITLAGKIPSDIAQTLSENPEALRILRSLAGDVRSAADWRRLLRGDREED